MKNQEKTKKGMAILFIFSIFILINAFNYGYDYAKKNLKKETVESKEVAK